MRKQKPAPVGAGFHGVGWGGARCYYSASRAYATPRLE